MNKPLFLVQLPNQSGLSVRYSRDLLHLYYPLHLSALWSLVLRWHLLLLQDLKIQLDPYSRDLSALSIRLRLYSRLTLPDL
jgi:hypothetical protein